MTVHLLQGDCREMLTTLPDASVQMCVTSPPYFGLRDYGTASWEGGDAACDHLGDPFRTSANINANWDGGNDVKNATKRQPFGATCGKCGARRIDQQIGLESTVEAYVAELVAVFREVRRVLRDDGVLFLNLGDSYAGSSGQNRNGYGTEEFGAKAMFGAHGSAHRHGDGLKPKDLIGIPWRVAFALQQPYAVPTCVESESDRSWLAAMMDGEGCIGIRRFDSYREEKQQVYQDGFVVYTVVTNSDIAILDHCVDITGYGKTALKQSAGDTDKRGIVARRDSYGWRLDGNKAVDVVRAVYPYLIAKRKQACIAYTLDQLNKNGHGSRAVPKEVQEKKAYLKDLINLCNQREHVDLPSWIQEPKQEIEPGWYLRSDIIWHKPNPMPESVRDRPTKSHEYIFLLTKQARYFWDAEAVKEPVTQSSIERLSQPTLADQVGSDRVPGKTNGNMKAVGDPSGRNIRSVWTIATAPFSDWTQTVRQRRVVWDEVSGDTTRIPSEDCPVHALWDHRHSTDASGVRVDDDLNRTLDSGGRLVLVPVTDSASTHLSRDVGSALDSSGLLPHWYAQTAIDRSNGSHKTDPAPATSPPCTPCVETPSHTGDTLASPAFGVPRLDMNESSISTAGLGVRPSLDSPDHTLDTPLESRFAVACSCSFVREVTESISHFATFPPELAERCIKAGTSEKGACAACGAPWVRVVETAYVPHGESAKAQVKTTFGERTSGDLELGRFRPQEMPYGRATRVDTTVGWQPSCACTADTVPCTVLDCFAGAGTTGLVADRLSRDAVLIELNPQYVEMIRSRITNDAPLFAEVV